MENINEIKLTTSRCEYIDCHTYETSSEKILEFIKENPDCRVYQSSEGCGCCSDWDLVERSKLDSIISETENYLHKLKLIKKNLE